MSRICHLISFFTVSFDKAQVWNFDCNFFSKFSLGGDRLSSLAGKSIYHDLIRLIFIGLIRNRIESFKVLRFTLKKRGRKLQKRNHTPKHLLFVSRLFSLFLGVVFDGERAGKKKPVINNLIILLLLRI
mgnify:CR=1 FL=1